MKNILLALLVMPLLAIAQKPQIDSFNGMKFGVSKDEAIKSLQRFGASLNYIDDREELVAVGTLKVAGIQSREAFLRFINNQFFKGIIEFDVNNSNFMQVYNSLKQTICNQYGYGKDFSWFDAPYYLGDGNELECIAKQKGKLCHAWGDTKQITSDNYIALEVCADKVVRVVFQNHAFAVIASRKLQQLSSN